MKVSKKVFVLFAQPEARTIFFLGTAVHLGNSPEFRFLEAFSFVFYGVLLAGIVSVLVFADHFGDGTSTDDFTCHAGNGRFHWG